MYPNTSPKAKEVVQRSNHRIIVIIQSVLRDVNVSAIANIENTIANSRVGPKKDFMICPP